MKTLILFLLFSIFAYGQDYERHTYIYEKVLLDESPTNNSAINECETTVDFEKVLISSKSNPRIYFINDYATDPVTLNDGLTYKMIKAKSIILTYTGMKLGNKTFRVRIILPNDKEANYELVEIVKEIKN